MIYPLPASITGKLANRLTIFFSDVALQEMKSNIEHIPVEMAMERKRERDRAYNHITTITYKHIQTNTIWVLSRFFGGI